MNDQDKQTLIEYLRDRNSPYMLRNFGLALALQLGAKYQRSGSYLPGEIAPRDGSVIHVRFTTERGEGQWTAAWSEREEAFAQLVERRGSWCRRKYIMAEHIDGFKRTEHPPIEGDPADLEPEGCQI